MKLTLHELINQATTDSHEWFPGQAQELPNQVLCMAGEVGEVANLVKKHVRGTMSHDEMMAELPDEVIDVLIYLVNLMGNPIFSHVDWGVKWQNKREFNASRFGRPDEIIVGVGTLAPKGLPQQVLAEAGQGPEITQTWQTPGEFAS